VTATTEPRWPAARLSGAHHGQFADRAPRAGEPQRAPGGAEFRRGRAAPIPGEPPTAGSCFIAPAPRDGEDLTVTRYLGQPSPATTPGKPQDLLVGVLADTSDGATRIAVVCDQPDLSKEDASQVITGLRHRLGRAGTGSVDIYGYDWSVDA
jgi:hypothetical protein